MTTPPLGPLDLIDSILQRRRDGLPTAIDLPGTERLVLITWLRHVGEDGTAWPSMDTLAREAGLSERPVRAAHKRLRERGVLVVVGTVRRGALRCRLDLEVLLGARPEEPRANPPRSKQPRSNQPENRGQINRGTAVKSTEEGGSGKGVQVRGSPPLPPPARGGLNSAHVEWVADQVERDIDQAPDPERAAERCAAPTTEHVAVVASLCRPSGHGRSRQPPALPGAPSGLRQREIAAGMQLAAERWRARMDRGPPDADSLADTALPALEPP